MVVWLPPQKSTVDRRNQCVLLRLTPAEYYGQYDLMVTPESNRVVGDIHNIRAEVLVRRYQFQTQTRAA